MFRGTTTLFRTIFRTSRSFGKTYGKSKASTAVGGLIIATSVVRLIGKLTPRISRLLGKGMSKLGRGKKAGRGANVPSPKEGSMQQAATDQEEGEPFQEQKPIKKRMFNRMRKSDAEGEDAFSKTRNSSTLTAADVEKMSKPLEGNALRLQEQIIETCKRYNLQSKSLKVTYELDPLKKGMWLHLENKLIKVSERGIYSAMNNPYYLPKQMSKSDGLTRLVADYSNRQINFFVNMLMSYEMNLYTITKDEEVQQNKEQTIGQQEGDQGNSANNVSHINEKKEPKVVNELGFEEYTG